jgi:ribosomal protein S27AE
MKKSRNEIVHLARIKYIQSGITGNLTEAIKLYNFHDLIPEERIDVFISTPIIHQVKVLLEVRRPECDACGALLFMSLNATDPTGDKYPVAWHCKKCGMIYYSKKSIDQWHELLKNENIKP